MKKTTQIFSASIITLFALVLFAGIQTATAQEWLVFSNKSVLTLEGGDGNLSNTAPKDENNWLNTQTERGSQKLAGKVYGILPRAYM